MSALLASYFAELFQEQQQQQCHDDGDDAENDDDGSGSGGGGGKQMPLPELIVDNARLPSPCFGRLGLLYMGTDSEVLGSCHTRSTTSTYGSTISDVSSHSNISAGSTGSNSSAGSCRWDSNPSSSSKVVEKSDQLKRPKRPGRKMSDNNKVRSSKPHHHHQEEKEQGGDSEDSLNSASHDRPINRPSRSNSNNNKNGNSRRQTGVPQRPTRSSSSECKQTRTTAMTTFTSKRHQETTVSVTIVGSTQDSLDKMLLCSKQKTMMQHHHHQMGDHSSESLDSEHSLKEIFRTASHSRQRTSGSGTSMMLTSTTTTAPHNVKPPLPGTSRTSPPRSVNEILGQSMEELKISW